MPLVHEFGIINDINLYSSYSPKLNNSIQVYDEIVQMLVSPIMELHLFDLNHYHCF